MLCLQLRVSRVRWAVWGACISGGVPRCWPTSGCHGADAVRARCSTSPYAPPVLPFAGCLWRGCAPDPRAVRPLARPPSLGAPAKAPAAARGCPDPCRVWLLVLCVTGGGCPTIRC